MGATSHHLPSATGATTHHEAGTAAPRAALSVLGLAVSLLLLIVPARLHLIGYTPDMVRKPFRYGTEMLISASYDVAFVLAVTGVFLGLLWLVRRRVVLCRGVVVLFALSALVILLTSLANVPIVQRLGHPFNYPWLYYSDFLASAEAHAAIAEAMSWRVVAVAVGCCAGLFVIGWIVTRVTRILGRWIGARQAAGVLIPTLAVYLLFSHWFLVYEQWEPQKHAHPVYWFAKSIVEAMRMPRLLTMHTPVGPEDFQTFAERREAPAPATIDHRWSNAGARPRNVIFFVHESTSAHYMDLFGGRFAVTPELARYSDRAIRFEAAYANSPATAQSMVTLLCSAYPMLSYQSATVEWPAVPLASLSDTLRRDGYRTAFFSSARQDYLSCDQFLSHRGFDVISEPQHRGSNQAQLSSEWWFINGSDDRSTVESMIEWIGPDATQPFFAAVWTLQAHYPYFITGQPQQFDTGHKDLDRYLAAIHETDQAFGLLMRHLEAHGMLEDTLVVVVGDHGETLDQHGGSKGRRLYEENIHVPLMFINSRLFNNQRDTQLAAMIDVAPSVMHLLGKAPPDLWQGRNLFGDERRQRVYHCAPWSDWLFAYREGQTKLILNATSGHCEVYDLAADPLELDDIAARSGAFIERAQQHLAAWAQYQHGYYERLGDLPPAAPSHDDPPLQTAGAADHRH